MKRKIGCGLRNMQRGMDLYDIASCSISRNTIFWVCFLRGLKTSWNPCFNPLQTLEILLFQNIESYFHLKKNCRSGDWMSGGRGGAHFQLAPSPSGSLLGRSGLRFGARCVFAITELVSVKALHLNTLEEMFGQTDPKPADHRGLSTLRRCFADIPHRNGTGHPASPGPSWHLQGRADCL